MMDDGHANKYVGTSTSVLLASGKAVRRKDMPDTAERYLVIKKR